MSMVKHLPRENCVDSGIRDDVIGVYLTHEGSLTAEVFQEIIDNEEFRM